MSMRKYIARAIEISCTEEKMHVDEKARETRHAVKHVKSYYCMCKVCMGY